MPVKPVLGMHRYGKNFKAISEAMGTKTQSNLKTFYVHYRKRYSLDTILKKYEAEQNSIIELSDDEDEQVIRKDESSSTITRQSTPSSLASGTRLISNLTLNSKTHQTTAAAK
ncbi:REST corepressor 1-like isoform X2 [Aphis craccivora]|uniref:REST corepressor 1-like isoform X2 n=1 Tax=Aphis craccivora TaxID=307492 RepID=A0A6G0ZNC0_APHCR|nr:REST corepressor 1-like isoform X2 [Aphis craccivora]